MLFRYPCVFCILVLIGTCMSQTLAQTTMPPSTGHMHPPSTEHMHPPSTEHMHHQSTEHMHHPGTEHMHHPSTEHVHNPDDPNSSHQMEMYFHFDYMEYILFYEWMPMSTGAMVGSCCIVAVGAILYEGLKQLRHVLMSRRRKSAARSNITIDKSDEDTVSWKEGLCDKSHLLQTCLHFLQAILSYSLMLIVMTYNVWLFFAVVLGLTIGYYLFAWPRLVISDENEHCH